MAKPSHSKRTRPRPEPIKRRHITRLIAADRRAQREVERWRRAG